MPFLNYILALCLTECLHGGTCSGPEYCTCPRNYTGAHCEIGLFDYYFIYSLDVLFYALFLFFRIRKECLNSDGHQFHQPIPTKRTITSHLNWTHWTQKLSQITVRFKGILKSTSFPNSQIYSIFMQPINIYYNTHFPVLIVVFRTKNRNKTDIL